MNNENGNYEVVTHEPMQNKQQLLEKAISSLSGVDAMWKLFVKRNLYDRNSLQFEDGINACEDYIMSIKLFYYSNLTVDISNVLYYYTVIGNSYSYTKNYELFLVDRIKAIGAVKTFLELNDIWQTYKKALYARIIMCKQTYLINKEYFNIDKYYTLYPEANKTWRNFAKASPEVKKFFGNVRQVKELARTDIATVNTVTKGQFLKQYEIITERQREQRLLPENMKEQLLKLQSNFIKQIGD